MKKTILHSFVWAIVFSLTCFLILYAVKARQATNPTTDSEPTKIYVNAGETLSATKWNNLASKVMTWQDVATSDTANFDTGCMRRWYLDDWSNSGYFYPKYVMSHQIQTTDPLYQWYIDKWAKAKCYRSDSATYFNVLKIQKLCP